MARDRLTSPSSLFDMDGTLVDSTPGVIGAWESFAKTYRHLNVPEILPQVHGVRTIDNLRRHCGIEDDETLEKEATRFELEIVDASVRDGRAGIILLPGSLEAISTLSKATPPSTGQLWAICTSATREYAVKALEFAGIPAPIAFVSAQDVSRGKPNPDPYLLGALKAGVDVTKCLVVEDAPSGIRAGKAAGAKVLALLTSHSADQVQEEAPDWVVENLSEVSFEVKDDKVTMSFVPRLD